MDWITRSKFKEEERLLQSLGFRLQGEAKQLLSRGEERVRTCSSRIFLAAKSLGKQEIVTLSQKSELLKKESQRYLKQQMDRVSQLELQSRQLNPASLLKKGYTRTEKEGIPIHKILVTPGYQLITFTATQKISSTVQTMDKK